VDQKNTDNRANQLNPNHPAYHSSRGASTEAATDKAGHHQPALDNHCNQLNPSADAYARSRDGQAPVDQSKSK
jgi:hypothetical protein